MKIILVDTSKTFMAAIRKHLAASLPDIEITEYDAEQQGMPGADFRWDLYDFAVLSHELGDGPSGLEWLRRFGGREDFPPTALVAEQGDEYLAVRAMKAGASDYIRRVDVRSDRLLAALREAGPRVRPSEEQTQVLDSIRQDTVLIPSARDSSRELEGEHRFIRLIGQGGFSRVYLAERSRDRAPVVLKIIDTLQVSDQAVVQRFIREAQIIGAISDPHVVKVFDQGFTPEYGYISMEFFQQGDLKQKIEKGVAPALAVDYMRGIARGLRAIHAEGIIHRDLKPGNIMFRADGSLAIADFGIAKRVNETQDLTAASGVLGTPSYLSPEQAMGLTLDFRSDLYSAGIIFFELLAGRKPYRADSPAGLVYQHLHAEIPRLPGTLATLQPVIDLLLAKDPAGRFGSAAELLETLDDWMPENFPGDGGVDFSVA